MITRLALLICMIAFSAPGFSNTDAHGISVLKANVQALQKENQVLKAQNTTLETRLKALETKIPEITTSISNAQTSANNAQTSANKAQTSADQARASYTSVAHGHLRGFHDQCVPSAANGSACFAATHRYCNSIGFAGGLIQEVSGDAYGVACFR